MDLKDSDGVLLIRQLVEKCFSNEGKGWVDYRWPHPQTKELAPKHGYIERIPGTEVCIGTGIYK